MNKKTSAALKREAEQETASTLQHHMAPWADRLSEGADAWSEMKDAQLGKSKRVGKIFNESDATRIARHLYMEKPALKETLKKSGHTLTDLCNEAFGHDDSKELYRLMLLPDEDPAQRNVRRNVWKYYSLIEAWSKMTNENVNLIANRVLFGTSLHPATPGGHGFEAIDRVQVLLQQTVDNVDSDFGLFKLFKKTAELKVESIRHGRPEYWPTYDNPLPQMGFGGEVDEDEATHYRTEREKALDITQALMQKSEYYGKRRPYEWQTYGFDTGVVQDCEFFYVPHAPLGYLAIWDLKDRREDEGAYEVSLACEIARMRSMWEIATPYVIPGDDFDEVMGRPVGQSDPLETEFQYFFWLVIYLHQDGKRLVPALYRAGEESGAYLLPIDKEVLRMLTNAHWVTPDENKPVIDRLMDLLIPEGDGELSHLEAAFRRTAPWFSQNPQFKAWQRHEAAQLSKTKKLEDAYHRLLKR